MLLHPLERGRRAQIVRSKSADQRSAFRVPATLKDCDLGVSSTS
jgi:hypothetical protein